ncbi:MAG TPA: hypothetical protein VKQ08_08255 [Cyclobacteriaceae bacterium]|nr:hypothetical protein [Cyclobacteriaceae bacterium]
MKTAGYSGTPLAKKLGIKEHFIVKLINAPDYYFDLFTDFPKDVRIAKSEKSNVDFIHYFSKTKATLVKDIPLLKKQLATNGMIWVSWYKKAANIPTDVTEGIVRDLALKSGLVDIKVCAVDNVWSGLKLVIPVKDRMRTISV